MKRRGTFRNAPSGMMSCRFVPPRRGSNISLHAAAVGAAVMLVGAASPGPQFCPALMLLSLVSCRWAPRRLVPAVVRPAVVRLCFSSDRRRILLGGSECKAQFCGGACIFLLKTIKSCQYSSCFPFSPLPVTIAARLGSRCPVLVIASSP